MKMENQIKSDRKEIRSEMVELKRSPKKNYRVEDPDYDLPTVMGPQLPLEHSQGLFQYFSKINRALTYAIQNGFLPREMLPKRAPHYLTELVRE